MYVYVNETKGDGESSGEKNEGRDCTVTSWIYTLISGS